MIPTSIYNFNVVTFISQLFPPLLRKNRLLAILNALLKPIISTEVAFNNFKDRVIHITQHNAKIILFEKTLNDIFDFQQRRIYINNAQLSYGEFWYDDEDEYFYDDEDMYWYDDDRFNQSGGNFTVFVPEAMRPTTQQLEDVFITKLRGEIELYKIYGTTYKIEWYV